MRVIVYDDTFEPITAVKLCAYAVQHCRDHHTFRMAQVPVFEAMPPTTDKPIPMQDLIVELDVIWLHRANQRNAGLLLVAKDHESALLVESIFLAGQQRKVREIEQTAFFRGGMAMVRRLQS